MVFRLFRRKTAQGKAADGPLAPVKPDGMDDGMDEAAATGAGTPMPGPAQPQALKAPRSVEAGKGRRPAPKPARKGRQPAKAVRKAGASGKAAKPKKGKK